MQGVFLDAIEQYVRQELGQTGLARMRSLVGRGDKGYQFDSSYPDEELGLIVRGVVEATGKPPEQVLEEFAEGMVPGLLEVYGFLVDPRWSFLDFLLNTEAVIHKGVKLNTPKAKPPSIRAEALGPDAVAIVYRSRRMLCPVARGIIRGAAKHYRVAVAITEDTCMLRGDPECYITVRGQ
jgi:hypothetical protein